MARFDCFFRYTGNPGEMFSAFFHIFFIYEVKYCKALKLRESRMRTNIRI